MHKQTKTKRNQSRKERKKENKGDKEKENVVVNSIYGKSNVIRYRL